MSDLPPPAPVPASSGPQWSGQPFGYAGPVAGRPPESVGGVYYSTGLTILLTIVTLGVWGILWTYRTNEDLKKYNGDGLGGVIAVVLCVLSYSSLPLGVVLMFTIPDEISKLYQRDGRQSPVSAVWGLWFLLPIVGPIVWYVNVQRSLNEFWLSKGASAV